MGVSYHKVRNMWHAQYQGKSFGYAATPQAAAKLVSEASGVSPGDSIDFGQSKISRASGGKPKGICNTRLCDFFMLVYIISSCIGAREFLSVGQN